MAELIEINKGETKPLAVLCGVDTGAFDMEQRCLPILFKNP